MSNALESDILLRADASDGALSIVCNTLPPRWAGPPLHHHDFDEAFYVIEGEIVVQLDESVSRLGPGEIAFAPRGRHHTLANHSDRPARYLLVCTPGGFERYFARMMAEQAEESIPAWATAPVAETIVVGPQITAE